MQPTRKRSTGGTQRGDGNRQLGAAYALQGYFNYFGENTDGAGSISSNTVWTANSGNNIIKHFTNLTISASSTVTAACSGWALVFVDGNCTINSGCSLVVTSGASAIATAINLKTYDINGLTGAYMERAALVTTTIPAAGANGGATGTTGAGNVGSAGGSGATGGGGSGAGSTGGAATLGSGGAGAAGTSFSGGAGGGAGGIAAATGTNGTAGGLNGGAGGNAGNSIGSATDSAGGGAGNPGGLASIGTGGAALNGTTGTGGILILIVKGTLTIGSGVVISANGKNGGNATGTLTDNTGGGGSGGGSIIIMYGLALSNSGSITANGGAGGTASGAVTNNFAGGNGGAGSLSSSPFQIAI